MSSAVPEVSVVELPAAEFLEHLRGPDVVDVVLAAPVDVGRRVERLVGQILDVYHLDGDVVADAGVLEQLRHLRMIYSGLVSRVRNPNICTHNAHERQDVLREILAVVLVHLPVSHHLHGYVQLLRH
jgi:hypothetical protein